jgi:hypothetical protein
LVEKVQMSFYKSATLFENAAALVDVAVEKQGQALSFKIKVTPKFYPPSSTQTGFPELYQTLAYPALE